MIPTNTGKTSPCDPVSSNCVIWQGPDLPCINLCNGDTISDVIAKIAIELCDLIETACDCDPDMSSVTLTPCLPPGTTMTVQGITQAIIDYMCDPVNFPGTTPDISCTIPECMQSWASPPGASSMLICDYAQALAKQICILIDIYDNLQARVGFLEDKVAIL